MPREYRAPGPRGGRLLVFKGRNPPAEAVSSAMSPALVPVGGRFWLKSKFTGAVAYTSVLVARVGQAGTSMKKAATCPGGTELVRAMSWLKAMGTGTVFTKTKRNSQLTSSGAG